MPEPFALIAIFAAGRNLLNGQAPLARVTPPGQFPITGNFEPRLTLAAAHFTR